MKFPRVSLAELRVQKSAEIVKLAEIKQRKRFRENLATYVVRNTIQEYPNEFCSGLSNEDLRKLIDGGILTFLLHCEARIASSLGLGFYTIGPCGEELLGTVALHLRPTDASALHYRHVATSVTRQLVGGKSIFDIALARARGFVCSSLDPITGGRHCSIGGSPYDFIVTSTLASQAPPAVGRALAIPLSNRIFSTLEESGNGNGKKRMFPPDAISYVSFGDGSVNNAHFLAALNLAKYSQHRGLKCPVVFAISDNDKCISLRGHGWIQKFVQGSGIAHFIADGSDLCSVYKQSKAAIDCSRSLSRPVMLLFENVPRRFGHAATDRQFSYMSEEEIQTSADSDPLGAACLAAIAAGAVSVEYVLERFDSILGSVELAFDEAVNEPKLQSRDDLVWGNSVPLVPRRGGADGGEREGTVIYSPRCGMGNVQPPVSEQHPPFEHRIYPSRGLGLGLPSFLRMRAVSAVGNPGAAEIRSNQGPHTGTTSSAHRTSLPLAPNPMTPASASALVLVLVSTPIGELNSMRKHMTSVYRELLSTYGDVVYIGEDVQHGGYYLVTEGLAAAFPLRVRDFPPDETTLIGAGMGYSQAGLVPIVEIPYAKYLDCASDMFLEAVSAHWLSNGAQKAGMLIRLQGFDKGVFGGNFHTHNSLPLPPGLDVVCYSNGRDYVRGVRYAMRQVRGGRVVLCVDSTDLLNRRHLDEGMRDGLWLSRYPTLRQEQGQGRGQVVGSGCGGGGGSGGGLETVQDIEEQRARRGVEGGLKAQQDETNEAEGKQEQELEDDEMSFGDIVLYHRPSADPGSLDTPHTAHTPQATVIIVTYGNGVPTSLLAVETFYRNAGTTSLLSSAGEEVEEVVVVDCPCLSELPKQLEQLLSQSQSPTLHSVLFADVCKLGAGTPLSTYAVQLQNGGAFSPQEGGEGGGDISWAVIGATNTYNPLGNTITFLNSDDVTTALGTLITRNNNRKKNRILK